jgi:hypothetical protein
MDTDLPGILHLQNMRLEQSGEYRCTLHGRDGRQKISTRYVVVRYDDRNRRQAYLHGITDGHRTSHLRSACTQLPISTGCFLFCGLCVCVVCDVSIYAHVRQIKCHQHLCVQESNLRTNSSITGRCTMMMADKKWTASPTTLKAHSRWRPSSRHIRARIIVMPTTRYSTALGIAASPSLCDAKACSFSISYTLKHTCYFYMYTHVAALANTYTHI